MSRELAYDAGVNLMQAMRYSREENWGKAREAMKGLYEIVRKTVGLALEPEIVANIEVDLWQKGETEDKMREFLGEKFRFSELQAAKSAHLAILANKELKRNPKLAQNYLEKFYVALKERVA